MSESCRLFQVAAVWMLVAPSVQAATFSDLEIFGPEGILNTGILVEANNFGDSPAGSGTFNGARPTTVNGVHFGNDHTALVNGTGQWMFAGGPSNDYSLAFQSTDLALDDLLSGSANFPSNSWATLRMRDLIPNFDYRLQIPATLDRFAQNGSEYRHWSVEIPGAPLYNFTMDGGGNGDVPDSMVATFTAPSQTVDVRLTAGGGRDVHIMGYSLFLLTDTPQGDVNLDGKVDLIDFSIFKTHFGDFDACPTCELTGDETVGLDDFNVLKANFGKSAPVGIVPEPPPWVLAGLAFIGGSVLLTTRAGRAATSR